MIGGASQLGDLVAFGLEWHNVDNNWDFKKTKKKKIPQMVLLLEGPFTDKCFLIVLLIKSVSVLLCIWGISPTL